MITIDDFAKIEIRVGTILEAEEVEGSEKLIRLMVDLGEGPPAGGPRQILAGVKQWYKDPLRTSVKNMVPRARGTLPSAKAERKAKSLKSLVGKQVVVIANLEPRVMMGHQSQGMLLAADCDNKPVFLKPSSKVPPGTKIR
ncbi:methionine--tRNA ligase [Candidatus Daviesbacteria bacterium]|nr:methionine--tRNA ligase [Candidatus Daviesbacteria bacterium]